MVNHATHIEFAVDMIVGYENPDTIIKFRPKRPEGLVNGISFDQSNLLYFAFPLGSAWPKTCRYGSVNFGVSVQQLLDDFNYAIEGKMEFYILGTSKYKKEFSHKVLVTSMDDPLLKKENLPLLREESLRNPNLPISLHGTDWFVHDRHTWEQMELVLKFPSSETVFKTRGHLTFVDHRDICVPSITRDLICARNLYDPVSKKFIDQSKLRLSDIEAPLEFVACIIVKKLKFPCVHAPYFQDSANKLVERLTKMSELAVEEMKDDTCNLSKTSFLNQCFLEWQSTKNRPSVSEWFWAKMKSKS